MRGLVTMAAVAVMMLAGGLGRASVPGGVYDLYRGGSQVGSERFAWTEGDNGTMVLQGECLVEMDGLSTMLRPSLTIDGTTAQPVHYACEISRGDKVDTIETTFEGGKASLATRKNGTSSKKVVKIKPADMVVDDHFVSLFILAARHYDFARGGEQDLIVFHPATGKGYAAHCKTRGLGTFENSSGSYRLKKLTIDLEDVAVDLLVDDEGRVPLISVPLRDLEARLQDYRGASDSKAENVGRK